jgi:hypothetical protein
MGQPPAKELLPLRAGRPLIEQPFLWARARSWSCHVISRQQKTALNEYAKLYGATVQIIEPGVTLDPPDEWPHTVLASEPYWSMWNLLVLPDTDYAPTDVWDRMFAQVATGKGAAPTGNVSPDVDSLSLVVATHLVSDLSQWGFVHTAATVASSVSTASTVVGEKIATGFGGGRAWGLLLFHRRVGRELFQGFIESHRRKEPVALSIPNDRVSEVQLEFFKDLTRP